MNRRKILLGLASIAVISKPALSAVQQPYKVSLVAGGRTEGLWQAGILVEMEKNWKTYWRVPGDAGIPPQFDWTGSQNVASVDVGFPIPTRFQDITGEAIGYHDRVLFPVDVKTVDATLPVTLKLSMFFAVCEVVCIPANVTVTSRLETASSSPLIAQWRARVPKSGEGATPIVSGARLDMEAGKPMLVLKVSQPLQDIFVEADSAAYFGKPQFDKVSGEAWLPVANIKDAASLHNLMLKLTLSFGDSGIEQSVAVT